jgi:hypothetical protein
MEFGKTNSFSDRLLSRRRDRFARAAIKRSPTEGAASLGHLRAQRARSRVKCRRGLLDALVLGHGEKVAQMVVVIDRSMIRLMR